MKKKRLELRQKWREWIAEKEAVLVERSLGWVRMLRPGPSRTEMRSDRPVRGSLNSCA